MSTVFEITKEIREIRDKVIKLESTSERWFGNGQPGDIEDMIKDIEDLKNLKWKLIGGGAVLIFLMEFFRIGIEKALASVIH